MRYGLADPRAGTALAGLSPDLAAVYWVPTTTAHTALHVVGRLGSWLDGVAAKDEVRTVCSTVLGLRKAKNLQVSIWAQPGKSYPGVLRELAPDTDSITRTYSARISVKDPDSALRLGMTASVQIPNIEGGSAIRVRVNSSQLRPVIRSATMLAML